MQCTLCKEKFFRKNKHTQCKVIKDAKTEINETFSRIDNLQRECEEKTKAIIAKSNTLETAGCKVNPNLKTDIKDLEQDQVEYDKIKTEHNDIKKVCNKLQNESERLKDYRN